MRLAMALGATALMLAVAGWLIDTWVMRATPRTKFPDTHGRT